MAVVKNLMVRAGADFSAITKQSNKVKTAMRGMQTGVTQSSSRISTSVAAMQKTTQKACSVMSSTVSAVGKAFQRLGAIVSVAAIVSFAKDAKEAYDTQAAAEAKLAQVMRNTIGASSEEIKAITDLTAAQQALGVVGDEVQLAGAQELATYVTMTSTLETLIPVMNDMVAQQYGLKASGENAAGIATMLGKVLSGQTSALSRYGYTFTKAQEEILKYGTEAQRAATLAEVVGQSVGGMNAALAATPSGRLQQVSNTLGDIKENFGKAVTQVATVFLPALNVVCSVLASMATLANKVAQSIANVFGGGASSAAKTVSYTAAAAGAMDDLTDATEGAGKAANSLDTYGFDTLQKLSGASSSGSGTAVGDSGGLGGGTIVETTSGADEAGETVGWLEKALARLKATATSLNFEPLAGAFDRLKNAAAPLTRTLFSGLEWAYDNILDPLAHWTVESALPSFLDVLAASASACDPALKRLGAALAPLAAGAFAGLKWGYDNVLVPLWTWTGSELLPAFLDLLANAADALTSTLSALQPVGSWLWNELLQPMATWTGDTIIAGLRGVSDILAGVSTWLQENPAAVSVVVDAAITYLQYLKTTFIAAVEYIKNAFSLAFGVIEGVMTGSWDNARAAWSNCVVWFDTYILTPLQDAFSMAADFTSQVLSDAWAGIQDTWSGVTEWFSGNVFTPVANGFRGFANGILGFFEGVVNGGINGVNGIISALNKISVSVPDWVPGIGGSSFGINLPTVSQVSLPRLASGAVFEGNDPYLAIVNDQKHGTNVETPLSTMIEAMMTALRAVDFGGNIQVDVKAVFEGQLAALARLLRPYFEADAKRVGNQASTAKGVV